MLTLPPIRSCIVDLFFCCRVPMQNVSVVSQQHAVPWGHSLQLFNLMRSSVHSSLKFSLPPFFLFFFFFSFLRFFLHVITGLVLGG